MRFGKRSQFSHNGSVTSEVDSRCPDRQEVEHFLHFRVAAGNLGVTAQPVALQTDSAHMPGSVDLSAPYCAGCVRRCAQVSQNAARSVAAAERSSR